MRLLLDTQVLLWALSEPEALRAEAASAIADPGNELYVSAATALEIAIKQSLGKLELPGPAETFLPEALSRLDARWLAIEPEQALALRALPWHHRDPFDRLLVAQAGSGFVLVTRDRRLEAYAVSLLWA